MEKLDDLRRRRADALELLESYKAGEGPKVVSAGYLSEVGPEYAIGLLTEIAELDKDIADAEGALDA